MATTAGVITLISKTSTSVTLSSAVATAGTGPYTYQWHRSLVSGFVPGPSNEIAGATSLDLTDTGLIPGTQYYYKMVATDSSTTPVEGISAQTSVVTSAQIQNPNQFGQGSQLGVVDLRFNTNTVSVMIDDSEAGTLIAGQAVKMVDSVGGVPKVIACAADADEVLGFINYDIKSVGFTAGQPAEISMSGNCMFLYATAAIARGVRVCLELDTIGGVKAATGATGACIVGWAYDKAAVAGKLIRIMLKTPSFELDS